MASEVKNIVAFGDSIAAGAGNRQRVSWLTLLRDHYYEFLNPEPSTFSNAWFYPQAIPGETAESLLEVIDSSRSGGHRGTNEIIRRHREYRRSLFILAIGGHQAAIDLKKKGEPDIQGFAYRMGKIAGELMVYGDILYVGMPLPDLQRVRHFSSTFQGFNYPQIKQLFFDYETAAIDAIREAQLNPPVRRFEAVPLVASTYRDMYLRHPRAYSASDVDGIHPSIELGHHNIFEKVRYTFEDMVGIGKEDLES